MIRALRALLVTVAAAAGGCGAQQALLGGEGEYLFSAFDALATPGQQVLLRGRLQGGDLLDSKGGYVVRFHRDGKLFKAAETDVDGVAAVRFEPPAAGDHRFTAELSPTGFAAGPPRPIELLIACRPADAPMLVVDLDRTLVASGFGQVLLGRAEPMPKSAAVMQRLAGHYTVVYLTHRPDHFGPKSKSWLREHGYPSGPVLLSDVGEFLGGSGAFKGSVLAELRKQFQKIQLGIGDKISDARAYHDNGLKAFLILHVAPAATPEELRGLASSLMSLPEAVQVVTGWDQIEEAVFDGKSFPRSAMVGKLTLQADLRELQDGAPMK